MFGWLKSKRNKVPDNTVRLKVQTFYVPTEKKPWQAIATIRGFQPSGGCYVDKDFVGEGIARSQAIDNLHSQIIELHGWTLFEVLNGAKYETEIDFSPNEWKVATNGV